MLTGLKVQPQRGCDGETNDFTEPRFFYTFLTFLIHTQDEKAPAGWRTKKNEYLMLVFVYFLSQAETGFRDTSWNI